MTAITKTKLNRLFEQGPDFKTVRKKNPEPADPRFRRSCEYCKLPMMVSVGQNAKYHKECRRNGRNAIQRTK